MIRITAISLFAVLFLHTFAGAQQIPQTARAGNAQVFPFTETYSFRYFDVENGPGNAYITALMQSSNGEIWAGTAGGGAWRYNGKSWKCTDKDAGLKSNMVQDVFEDRTGLIWFATYGGGIARLEEGKIIVTDTTNGFPDNYVWCIAQDSDGAMWFGTERAGAIRLHKGKITTYSKSNGLYSSNIRKIFCDSKNRIWLATEGGGLAYIEDGKVTTFSMDSGLPSNRVLAVDEDSKGRIWIGTYGGGICSFGDTGFDNYFSNNQGLPSRYVCAIQCVDDEVWIGMSMGGGACLTNSGLKVFSEENGLSNNEVIDVLRDRNGNVWFATYGGGISVLYAQQFTWYNEDGGFPSNVTHGIARDAGGNLWIGTSGMGLIKYEPGSCTVWNSASGLAGNYVMAVISDVSGKIWVATSGSGVCSFDGKQFVYINTKTGMLSDYTMSLCAGKNNELWIGTYGGGISCWNGTTVENYRFPKNSGVTIVYALTSDKSGTIYAATDKGCWVKSAGGFEPIPGTCDYSLKSVLFVDDKMFLASDGIGLGLLQGDKLQWLGDKDGLCSKRVESLCKTEDGTIWVGTASGICALYTSERPGCRKLQGAFQNYYLKVFQRPEGFIGNNCIANSAWTDTDNTVWIATGRGLLHIDPSKEIVNLDEPWIEINDVQLLFRSLKDSVYRDSCGVKVKCTCSFLSGMTFPYDQNHLTFEATGVNVSNPDRTTYSFWLEGAEPGWSPLRQSGTITYSGLPPGEYTLHVKAVNENGIESRQPATFSFEIKPPWWETTLFRILAVAAILLLILFTVRQREKKLIRDKRILEQKVKERTAEVVMQKEEIEAQRDEIESQRDLLSEQKKEITDSINYAVRIQQAAFPSEQELRESLGDFWLLFKPRDIVSGDFYWAANAGNLSVFAVADCTGHGVPGAFMSLLGLAGLHEIVENREVTEPGMILTQLRDYIVSRVSHGKGGETVPGISDGESVKVSAIKDGMDIALCTLNRNTGELKFAGANNPLYILRAGASEITEVKPDKMPVGFYEKMADFSTQTLNVAQGDYIYLFSDGFADQFGGEHDKKLKYKAFKDLLIAHSKSGGETQRMEAEFFFEKWKGSNHQVDDVTVMGICY